MDKPKIMYNPATKKMTAMEPKDDNLVNRIYNSPNPVKRVEKLVKETTPPSSIAEYNKQQQDKLNRITILINLLIQVITHHNKEQD